MSDVVPTSAMIALIPEQRELDRLVLADGEPIEELHVTLAFLGKAVDLPDGFTDDLQARLEQVADRTTLLQGEAWSVNHFNPRGEDPALTLGVGGAWLDPLRTDVWVQLAAALVQHPYELPENHAPWIPHLTLAYQPTPVQFDQAVEKLGPVMFDRLRLAVADTVYDSQLGRKFVVSGGT